MITESLPSTRHWRRAAGGLVGLLSIAGMFSGAAMLALGVWILWSADRSDLLLGIGLFCFGSAAMTCAIGLLWARAWAWWGCLACCVTAGLLWLVASIVWPMPGAVMSLPTLAALVWAMSRREMRQGLAELRDEARQHRKPVLFIC